MSNLLKILKETRNVLTTAAAVLAAAIVVVETYEVLYNRLKAAEDTHSIGDAAALGREPK